LAAPQHLKLRANSRTRAYFPINVTGNSGTAQIEIRGQAETGKLADAKRQTLTVVPAGYPVAASYGVAPALRCALIRPGGPA